MSQTVDGLFKNYPEIEVLELYFDEDYDAVDHDAFRAEVFDGLRALGMPEEDLDVVTVNLRHGSIIVLISGPTNAIRAARQLPLRSLKVRGLPVCLSKEEMLASRARERELPDVYPAPSRDAPLQRQQEKDRRPAYMSRPTDEDLEAMVQRLRDDPDSALAAIPSRLREEVAREMIDEMLFALCEPGEVMTNRSGSDATGSVISGYDGIGTSKPGTATMPARREAMLEDATRKVVERRQSMGRNRPLASLSDNDIRRFVDRVLDTWCSPPEAHSLNSSSNLARSLPRIVRIPRPGDEEIDQLTERVLTGRSGSGGSLISDEVREEAALGWLMEMQEPLLDAAETAPAMQRPSEGAVDRMVASYQGEAEDREAIVQEMLGEFGGTLFADGSRDPMASSSSMPQRPTQAQLDGMSASVAASRGMGPEQAAAVRRMLGDMTQALFGDASGPPTPAAARPAAPFARPSSAEISQMAASVAARCGNQELAKSMISTMTDTLFGLQEQDAVAPARSASYRTASRAHAGGLRRPSPRSLDTIAQRVLRRAGSQHEAVVRETLVQMTESLFPTGASRKERQRSNQSASGAASSVIEAAAGEITSKLYTARSSQRSGRSRSTGSEEVRRELNHEVRGLVTDLCTTIFADSPPPSSRADYGLGPH